MMNTRRATEGASWRLGLAGEPPHSRASAPVCQDGPASKSTASDLSAPAAIVLTGTDVAVLFLAFVAAIVTLFLFIDRSAFALPTGMGVAITVLFLVVRVRGRANAELVEKNASLVSTLGKSEQRRREAEKVFMEREWTIKELQSALKSAQMKIIKLELERQVLLVRSKVTLAGGEKPSKPPEYRPNPISLPPDGQEAFSPVLDSGRVYNIAIEGTCELLSEGFWGNKHPAGRADAFYRTNDRGAFSNSHEWLLVDGDPLVELVRKGVVKMGERDREAHRHAFQIKGSGQKVGICLRPYWREQIVGATPSNLTLTVEVLPEGTPLPGTACESNGSLKALEAELESLRLRAHCESHFLDPAFQSEFADRERAKIIQTLKSDWQSQYAKFMRKRPLKKLAEEEAPEVIEWLEARVKIVQLAERMMVAPPPILKEMSAEEAQAEMIRKKAVQHGKKIALAKLKGEKAAEADAVLESLPLDGDLKERLKTELTDSILDDEGEHEGRKDDVTL